MAPRFARRQRRGGSEALGGTTPPPASLLAIPGHNVWVIKNYDNCYLSSYKALSHTLTAFVSVYLFLNTKNYIRKVNQFYKLLKPNQISKMSDSLRDKRMINEKQICEKLKERLTIDDNKRYLSLILTFE